jgi:hypothetical protein
MLGFKSVLHRTYRHRLRGEVPKIARTFWKAKPEIKQQQAVDKQSNEGEKAQKTGASAPVFPFTSGLWKRKELDNAPVAPQSRSSSATYEYAQKVYGVVQGQKYDVDNLMSLIPKSILSVRMKETLKDLFKIAEGLYSRAELQPVHPLVLNLALLRLYANQAHEDSSAMLQRASEKLVTDAFTAEVLHFFHYASEVYNAEPMVRKQDIVLNQLQDNQSLHLPRHVVFLDHLTKSIVVSIRGTQSLSDMITDLYIKEAPFLEPSRGIVAHRGIAASAQALLSPITIAINDIRRQQGGKYANYRVVTTGHSLGAGTAVLLSMLLSTQSKIAVTSYAFAPPPVISHTTLPKPGFPFNLFSRDAECKIYSFVHDRDFISRCSHLELVQLLTSLTAVDGLSWSDLDRAAMVFRGKLSEKEQQEMWKVLQAAREKCLKSGDVALYIPGDIFLLRPLPTVKVETVQNIPGASSASSLPQQSPKNLDSKDSEEAGDKDKRGLDLARAWQQLVQKTASVRGTSVLSSKSAACDATGTGTGSNESSSEDGAEHNSSAEDKEEETERRRVEESRQYELVKVPSPQDLSNGLLYYGDSMVHDHLLTAYRNALLKLVT